MKIVWYFVKILLNFYDRIIYINCLIFVIFSHKKSEAINLWPKFYSYIFNKTSSAFIGRVSKVQPSAFNIAPLIAGAGVFETISPIYFAPNGPVGS